MKEIILQNGLKVLFKPMPNTHSVTVGLYIKAGLAFDDEPITGMTHLLEHLHFRHCGKYNQKELYYNMEKIGTAMRGTTFHDLLRFYMKVSPVYLNEALDIIYNLIISDEWTQDEFEKEKTVVKNQIYEDGDYADTDSDCRCLVFKGHPMSKEIMGSAEDVDCMTLEDIKEYKKKIFNTTDMLLTVTGNVTEENLLNSISGIGEIAIPSTNIQKKLTIPKRFCMRKPDVKFIDMQWDLPEVRIAFDVPVNKYDADMTEILNCILGEGVGSRLQLAVREDKGFTSDIYSVASPNGHITVIYIGFTVSKKNIIPCLEEIGNVLSDMKENISEYDLDISLPFFTTNTQFNEDDTEEMNILISHHLMNYNKYYSPSKAQNDEETRKVLKEMANDIFRKENMSLVIVGNTGKLTHKAAVNAIFKQ